MTKPCFVYILQSDKTGMFYIGCSSNLEDRIIRHNEGRSKFTEPYRPFKLVYSKKFDSKSEAMEYELKLKSFKTREALKALIEESM